MIRIAILSIADRTYHTSAPVGLWFYLEARGQTRSPAPYMIPAINLMLRVPNDPNEFRLS